MKDTQIKAAVQRKKNKVDKSNIFNLSYTFTKCHSITFKGKSIYF